MYCTVLFGNKLILLILIRRIVSYGNLSLCKLFYFGLFEQGIRYSIVLWGSRKGKLESIFTLQKNHQSYLEPLRQTSCREDFVHLGLMNVRPLYIYVLLIYVRSQNIKPPQKRHSYMTSHNTYAEFHRLSLFEQKPKYAGLKLFQCLPNVLQNIESVPEFKTKINNAFMILIFLNPGFSGSRITTASPQFSH
jgi:hypothetical protein